MKNDRELLKEANELIRSFSCVIERKGLDTNWDGLQKQTKRVLSDQHELKLFSLPSITNRVKNAACNTCKNCDLYENENSTPSDKYYCKDTEDFLNDINNHYCNSYEKE